LFMRALLILGLVAALSGGVKAQSA
jgi:hypothetical protein